MDRKACAVDQNMDWLVASWRTDGELPKLPGSPADRGVVWDSAVQNEQRKQGSEKALCLTQSKLENHAHRQGYLDGAVGILSLTAGLSLSVSWWPPSLQLVLRDPHRQIATLLQTCFVLRPVCDL